MPLPPLPWKSHVLEGMRQWTIARDWGLWFDTLRSTVDTNLGTTTLTTQGASLAATTLATVPADGLYRLSYYVRITRAATTSSSLTVTLRWTDGGIAQVFTGTAITGNTTDSWGAFALTVHADQGSVITVETAYLSSGATSMQYRLDARAERVL